MHDDAKHSIDAAELRVGARLRTPLYDDRGVLLLAEGQVVTETFLAILHRRGTRMLRLDGCQPQRPGSGCDLDALVSDPANVRLPPQEQAFAAGLADHGAAGYDAACREAFRARRRAAGRELRDAFGRLVRGNAFDLGQLVEITDEALADLRDDPDLFASLGLDPFAGDYPAHHSLQTAMLSLAVATHLHVDRPTLRELAIGCLIHDAGMLLIDRAAYDVPRRLSRVEFLEITKHPVRIFDRTRVLASLPARSALVAYQMHERCDGTGYPRGRLAGHIHLLSKVAAVADVFTALVGPRPHREALLPHAALRAVVKEAVRGRLDASSTLALLRTLSAYPLGSYVELSDGRVGLVVRSNGTDYERPVVEARERDTTQDRPDVVDLANAPELRITGPLPSPAGRIDQRFDAFDLRHLVEQLDWSRDDQVAPVAPRDAVRETSAIVSVTYPHALLMQTIVRLD